MSLNAAKIAELVSGILHGNPNAQVDDVSSISRSREGTLSFLSNPKEIRQLEKTSATVVLIPEKCDPGQIPFNGESLIVVDDPFNCFIQLLPMFKQSAPEPRPGIHPTAVVDRTATIGSNVTIGPHVSVGPDCRIGDGCHLHAGVVLQHNVTLGENVILHPRVVVYGNCELRNRVQVHSGSIIGADGFGYRFHGGAFHKIEHFGSVILEDDVEVGSCTTIDRGMFEPTVIGRGTKIDNLVMIAHNCQIGEHNVIVSQVGLAGSVSTGNYCRFGGQVGIADHLHIGEGANLMAQSGVFRNVEAGATLLGAPALPLEQQSKIMTAQTKLPETRQAVRRLQKQVEKLEAQLNELTSEDNSKESRRAA